MNYKLLQINYTYPTKKMMRSFLSNAAVLRKVCFRYLRVF